MAKKLLLLLLIFFSVTPALSMDQDHVLMDIDYDEIVTIQTQDGLDFQVAVDLIQLSGTIKNLIDDAGTENPIPLPNITAATWQLIQNQLENLYSIRNKCGTLAQSEQKIIDVYKNLDNQQLIDLIIAVNYLDIPELLQITTTIAKEVGIHNISVEQLGQLSRDIATPIVIDALAKILGPVVGQEVGRKDPEQLDFRTICHAPDGSKSYFGWLIDNHIHVQDTKTKEEITVYKGHTKCVTAICTAVDGRYVVSGSLDGTILVWDAATGKQVAQCNGHTAIVTAVCITKDNKIISSSGDGMLRTWDLITGQCLSVRPLEGATIMALCIMPNTHYLIAGSINCGLYLFDIFTMTRVAEYPGHTGMVILISHENGKVLSYANDCTYRIWDISLFNRLKELNAAQIKDIWQYLKEKIKAGKECSWQDIQTILDGKISEQTSDNDKVQPRLKRVKIDKGDTDV